VPPVLPAIEGEPGSVKLGADTLDADDGSLVSLRGNIQIRQEDMTLRADSGTYDVDTGNAELEGNIQVRQTGMLLTGSDGLVDNAGARSRLNNASYVLHEESVRGSAEVIVYTDADGIITIDNGVYTRCEPGNNSWVVEGSSIVLNQASGRGLARDVKLRLGNVPVMYLPVISFPINDERATGFLAPIIGTTRDGGLDVSTPYYLNLAPNYDATLTPRIMTDRGIMLGVEGRYRSRLSLNELQMNYLSGDNQYDAAELLLPNPESPPVPDRWQVSLDHVSRFARNWRGLIDYAAVSDEDYFQDLGNTGLYTTTQSFLHRTGGIEYRNNDWRFRAQALSYQIIDPTVAESNQPYKRLPRLTLDGNFRNSSGFDYGVSGEYVHFDRDLNPDRLTAAQLAAGALVTGQRLTLEPEVSYPWSSPGAFVTPKMQYKYASYELDDPSSVFTDDPSRGVLVGSLDSGLIFERDVEYNDTGMIQTLEPRLYYLYSEYEDQNDIPVFDSTTMTFGFNQLFREDRFSGNDRVGDTNQMTLAVSSRFLDNSGQEKASASIGQIRYFEDRRVTLRNAPGESERQSGSAIASEFSVLFSGNWRINSYLEWDTGENSLEVGNFQFRYQSDINHLLNFSYRFRDVSGNPVTAAGFDRRIRQTDVSGIWPVSQNWSLIGRWNYDHANSRNLESIAGLEYNNCCWSVRVIARQWIDNDALFHGNVDDNTGVFLQFELKGLGSVLGGNVSGILNNGISGYRERDYAQ
jgi:LPS-assembly protein